MKGALEKNTNFLAYWTMWEANAYDQQDNLYKNGTLHDLEGHFAFTYYYNKGEVWAVVNLGVRQNERYTERITKSMKTIDGLAYYLAECDTFYLVTNAVDDSLVAAAGIDRVGVVDRGDTVLFDLDKQTHLVVRRIEDRGAVQVLFDDYRDKNGVKLPYRMRVYQGDGRTEEVVFEDYLIDEKIDGAVFEEFRPKPKE